MPIFKVTTKSNEDWERHYEVEAVDGDEARAKVEQEIIEPVESHRREMMIIHIRISVA